MKDTQNHSRSFFMSLPATRSRRGFTLLLAALIASIVLMLGSSIFAIVQKQITLSSLGRDSQYAFYAADTGAECALYYDIRSHAFGTSNAPTVAQVQCDKGNTGADYSVASTFVSSGTAATSTFQMDLFSWDVVNNRAPTGPNASNCIQVTVAKNPTSPYTVIHSDGYSTPCNQVATSPRSLQRSVELRY